jgi:hypothetical protein
MGQSYQQQPFCAGIGIAGLGRPRSVRPGGELAQETD